MHNHVNERLGKPIFDCAHLDEHYDCGCGDEPINPKPGDASDKARDKDTGYQLIKGGR